MFKGFLRSFFNPLSSHTGQDCLINYVWINKMPDVESRLPECSVSLKHIDCAYKTARSHPESKVKIWIDYRFLDDRSRTCLDTHRACSAPHNVQFCDLNDIPRYRSAKLFNPDQNQSIWARVDLARLIVLEHALEQESELYAIYADFDTPDLRLKEAMGLMNEHGVALAKTAAKPSSTMKTWIAAICNRGLLENGYLAFKKNESGKHFLDMLLFQTLEKEAGTGFAYAALFSCLSKLGHYRAIPAVLPNGGYEIPDQKHYKELGWN